MGWSASINFVVVFSYWSINYIATELEMPFGDDPNDLPLHDMQNDLNASLITLMQERASCCPQFEFRESHLALHTLRVDPAHLDTPVHAAAVPPLSVKKTRNKASKFPLPKNLPAMGVLKRSKKSLEKIEIQKQMQIQQQNLESQRPEKKAKRELKQVEMKKVEAPVPQRSPPMQSQQWKEAATASAPLSSPAVRPNGAGVSDMLNFDHKVSDCRKDPSVVPSSIAHPMAPSLSGTSSASGVSPLIRTNPQQLGCPSQVLQKETHAVGAAQAAFRGTDPFLTSNVYHHHHHHHQDGSVPPNRTPPISMPRRPAATSTLADVQSDICCLPLRQLTDPPEPSRSRADAMVSAAWRTLQGTAV